MPKKPKPKLLIIDDDQAFYSALDLRMGEYDFDYEEKIPQFSTKADVKPYEAILFDLDYGTPYGFEEGLRQLPFVIRKIENSIPIIISTIDNKLETYRKAMDAGASHFLSKETYEPELWKDKIIKTVDSFRLPENPKRFITRSGVMTQLMRQCRVLAKYHSVPILINGEPGSGKTEFVEFLCREAYTYAPSFKILDFSSLNDDLLDQLNNIKVGVPEEPVLYLFKNIDKADIVIQENILDQLNGANPNRRFVFTTSTDLREAVAKGYFHQGFYDHLSIITIDIPPLHDRKEDLASLISYFLKKKSCCPKSSLFFGAQTKQVVHDEVIMQLLNFKWGSHVRELRSVVQAMVREAELNNKQQLDIDCLPKRFHANIPLHLGSSKPVTFEWPKEKQQAYDTLVKIEQVLIKSGGNKGQIEGILGIAPILLEKQVRGAYLRYPELFDIRLAITLRTFGLTNGFDGPVLLTLCAVPENKKTLTEIKKRLIPLNRKYPLNLGDNLSIPAGSIIDEYLEKRFIQTNIFLVLLCVNSVASDEFKDELIERAFNRVEKERNKAVIIPILTEHCRWKTIDPRLNKLKILPVDGKPIPKSLDEREKLLADIVENIEEVILKKFKTR